MERVPRTPLGSCRQPPGLERQVLQRLPFMEGSTVGQDFGPVLLAYRLFPIPGAPEDLSLMRAHWDFQLRAT